MSATIRLVLVGCRRTATVERALVASGYAADLTSIPDAGSLSLPCERYDLALVDIGTEALDVAATVCELRRQLSDIPVVALGPTRDPRRVASAFRAGVVEYVHDRTGGMLVHVVDRLLLSRDEASADTRAPSGLSSEPPPNSGGDVNQMHLDLIEGANDLIFTHDLDGWFTSANRACMRATGYSREEILKMNVRDVIAPDCLELAEAMTRQKLIRGGATRYEVDLVTHAGERLPLDVSTRLILGEHGPVGVQGIARDMSERRRAEDAIRATEHKLRALLDNVWLLCVGLDLDGRIEYANPYLLELSGYRRADVMGRNWFETFTPPEQRLELARTFQEILLDELHSHYENEIVTRTGTRRLISWNNVVVHDSRGRIAGTLSIGEDITERRQIEREMERQALHDSLTGLPNRVLFADRLQQALLAAKRDSESLAVLVMDLDRFKDINDTYGHQTGDQLLQQVSARLAATVRASDTVARLGGDEFAVILRGAGRDGAEGAARETVASLAGTYQVNGRAIDTGASVGIALYPDHGDDSAALLREADVAMYVAKRAHLGWSLYAPERDEHSPTRLALISDLRQAVVRDQLRLHWQPIVPLTPDGRIRAEALLRWEHPEFGFVSPETFIPLAEHTGLIQELTLWVVGEALRQCRQWYDRGLQIGISLNISPRGLHDPVLASTVSRSLRRHAVSPEWLELEVTESAVMADPERSMETLSRLCAMGVKLSIDDFGTGHSSLAYLQRFPVDTVKIDRRFVQDMPINADDQVIVRSVIELAHNLGLKVVAEGVESIEAECLLNAMRCDAVQGFYLSRPLPPDDFVAWLCARDAHPLTPPAFRTA